MALFGWLRTNKMLRKELAAQAFEIEGLRAATASHAEMLNLTMRQRDTWRTRANQTARVLHLIYAGHVSVVEGGLISRPHTRDEIKAIIEEHLK